MKKLIITITTLIMFNQNLYANSISNFAYTLGISTNDAKNIADNLTNLVITVQEGISYIADSENSYSEKIGRNGAIENVRSYFTRKKRPIIWVSSLKRKKGHRRSVIPYLKQLAKKAKRHNTKVKMIFEDRLHFDKYYKRGDTFYFRISDYQEYQSCTTYEDRTLCYSDVTKKSFNIKLKNSEYYLESITVIDTMTPKEYNELF